MRAHSPETLLARLDAIGLSLQHSGQARALLGLGSVGMETSRLDAYSDLDFFVIAKDGCKPKYLQALDWLHAAHPIAYWYQNTVDGHKVLFADGIFAEFAIFELHELATIPFTEGRIVWSEPGFDPTWTCPPELHRPQPPAMEWLTGEILSCLYVGMMRQRRGETLAAFQMIQQFAVENLLKLIAQQTTHTDALRDPYNVTRRYELLYPSAAEHLPSLMQGYAHNPESARAVLGFLESMVPVNPVIKAAIWALSEPD